MDLRAIQKPLKEKYRSDPNSSRITLRAHSDQTDTPIACSVEVGQKILKHRRTAVSVDPAPLPVQAIYCSARSQPVLN